MIRINSLTQFYDKELIQMIKIAVLLINGKKAKTTNCVIESVIAVHDILCVQIFCFL
jgi:hypothetical protein